MYNNYMVLQFECLACGGMIDFPNIDEILKEYDPGDTDKYNYEVAFEDELMVVCDWCKKRVEVPLDPPAGTLRSDPLKHFNEMEAPGEKRAAPNPWPKTRAGKIILGAMALICVFPTVALGINDLLVTCG